MEVYFKHKWSKEAEIKSINAEPIAFKQTVQRILIKSVLWLSVATHLLSVAPIE